MRAFRGIGRRPRTSGGLAIPAVMALSLVSAPDDAAAQGTLAPAGSIGLALVDLQPGVAFAGGTRIDWGRIVATGVLDLTVVGVGGDRYELQLAGLDLRCRDVIAAEDVGRSRCAEPELRVGAVLDAAVAFAGDAAGLRPLLGAGYRLGHTSTPFGTFGLTGRFGSGVPWYARVLAGRRFVQLQLGFAGGEGRYGRSAPRPGIDSGRGVR